MIFCISSQSWYLYSSSVCESTHLSTSVSGNGASAGSSPMSAVQRCSAGRPTVSVCWDRAQRAKVGCETKDAEFQNAEASTDPVVA